MQIERALLEHLGMPVAEDAASGAVPEAAE
jgi:hypothetical protein